MKKIMFYLLVFMGITQWTGCTTNINTLRNDPYTYKGQVVSLQGEVQSLVKIPLTSFYLYVLEDETGKIPVISKTEHKEGRKVRANYHVVAVLAEEAAEQGGQGVEQLKIYLEEKDWLQGKAVDITAQVLIKGIAALGSITTGTYFLIEE